MLPLTVCPATCELCGNWLPQHQSSCPRNGVHPSQWKLLPKDLELDEYFSQDQPLDTTFHYIDDGENALYITELQE